MAGKAQVRGGPPKKLTGQPKVSSIDSPWWAQVASDISLSPEMVGKVVSIEELTQMIPSYHDGRRPRPRTVARRLRHVLELVERGPNGSRGNGASYRIIAAAQDTENIVDDGTMVEADEDWLLQSIERMTGGK